MNDGHVEPASTVLLPLDGTRQSLAALPVARRMAELAGATLHIVHAAESTLAPDELRERLVLDAETLAGAVLDAVTGAPAAGIVRLAAERHSLLIVMAMHDGRPDADSGLGSVAEGVMRTAPCPVLLVPPERLPAAWRLEQVLLPQDGTPGTATAIGPTIHLAHRAGAELLVLHVAGPAMATSEETGALTVPRYMDQPQHEWPAWSREFLDRVRGMCHFPAELDLKLFLAKGEPGAEILRLAAERDADLIVLPWHGSLASDRALILKAVIRDAPCPVLVLPFKVAADSG